MNYLVIDLEMCKVPRDYRSKRYKYANETIQIGAVLLDEEFKRIGTLSQFVHPEQGVIDYFIENLTGIKNGQVKHAPRLQEALLHMLNWIGDREYKVYVEFSPLETTKPTSRVGYALVLSMDLLQSSVSLRSIKLLYCLSILSI